MNHIRSTRRLMIQLPESVAESTHRIETTFRSSFSSGKGEPSDGGSPDGHSTLSLRRTRGVFLGLPRRAERSATVAVRLDHPDGCSGGAPGTPRPPRSHPPGGRARGRTIPVDAAAQRIAPDRSDWAVRETFRFVSFIGLRGIGLRKALPLSDRPRFRPLPRQTFSLSPARAPRSHPWRAKSSARQGRCPSAALRRRARFRNTGNAALTRSAGATSTGPAGASVHYWG